MSKKLSQLVANEMRQKGQAFWKFLKAFYNTPSLIQGNSERLAQPKINSIYKLFTSFPLLYLPIGNGTHAQETDYLYLFKSYFYYQVTT